MTARLEDLKPDAMVQGLVGREAVRINTAQMVGEPTLVIYRVGCQVRLPGESKGKESQS